MPNLSIVIPVLGQTERFENTLVSVLENRPSGCEVLAVFNAPYADPYQLQDEVRFVQAPAGATWVESANVGLRESRAPVVHLLSCGAKVREGWTTSPLKHLAQARVATVAPVVFSAQHPGTVLCGGVAYRCFGRVETVGQGQSLASLARHVPAALGPATCAGFYRRDVVQDLLGGFDPLMGDFCADVDLALKLAASGLIHVLDTESQMSWDGPLPVRSPRTWREARQAERLFLRYLPDHGSISALALHGGLIAWESLLGLPRLSFVGQWLGRALAWSQRAQLRLALPETEHQATNAHGAATRPQHDQAHAVPAPRHLRVRPGEPAIDRAAS